MYRNTAAFPTLWSEIFRKAILSIIMLVFALTSYADEYYRVNCNSTLTIREYPDKSSAAIGRLYNGNEVLVIGFDGKWAQIKTGEYSTGYVHSDYIKPTGRTVQPKEDVQPSSKKDGFFDKINLKLPNLPKTNSKIWFYIALLFSVAMCITFFATGGPGGGEIDSPEGFYLSAGLFFCTCAAQAVYLLTYSGDITWFCSPDQVGWIWTIVNFLAFGFVVYCQVFSLLSNINNFHYFGGRSCGNEWGIYGIIGFLIAAIVCGIFFTDYLGWVAVGLVATQVVQIGLWGKATMECGAWGNFIALVVFYLFCTIVTLAVFAHFLALLIIVLMGLLVLSFLGSSSKRTCSSCRTYRNGYCHYRQEYVSSSSYCSRHQ